MQDMFFWNYCWRKYYACRCDIHCLVRYSANIQISYTKRIFTSLFSLSFNFILPFLNLLFWSPEKSLPWYYFFQIKIHFIFSELILSFLLFRILKVKFVSFSFTFSPFLFIFIFWLVKLCRANQTIREVWERWKAH